MKWLSRQNDFLSKTEEDFEQGGQTQLKHELLEIIELISSLILNYVPEIDLKSDFFPPSFDPKK
jgi:hypothetical protein